MGTACCDLDAAIRAAGCEMWETSPCCHIRMEEDGHHAADLESEIQPMDGYAAAQIWIGYAVIGGVVTRSVGRRGAPARRKKLRGKDEMVCAWTTCCPRFAVRGWISHDRSAGVEMNGTDRLIGSRLSWVRRQPCEEDGVPLYGTPAWYCNLVNTH
ncbi:hypothetical protein ACLOJK_014917 [Asimina triloba]